MAGLLRISEPSASNPTDATDNPNDLSNSLNNELLTRLATDATKDEPSITSTYSREDIAKLFDLPLMDLLFYGTNGSSQALCSK